MSFPNFKCRESEDNQVEHHLVEKFDTFFECQLVIEWFVGKLRVDFEDFAIDSRVEAMIIVAKTDKEETNIERLSFSAGMNLFSVIEKRFREDSEKKRKNFEQRNHYYYSHHQISTYVSTSSLTSSKVPPFF